MNAESIKKMPFRTPTNVTKQQQQQQQQRS